MSELRYFVPADPCAQGVSHYVYTVGTQLTIVVYVSGGHYPAHVTPVLLASLLATGDWLELKEPP